MEGWALSENVSANTDLCREKGVEIGFFDAFVVANTVVDHRELEMSLKLQFVQ